MEKDCSFYDLFDPVIIRVPLMEDQHCFFLLSLNVDYNKTKKSEYVSNKKHYLFEFYILNTQLKKR